MKPAPGFRHESQTINTLVIRIHELKAQRVDVRRSLTTHEALLLHADTKTVGLALGDVLRATEQRLTTLLGDATRQLREAQAATKTYACSWCTSSDIDNHFSDCRNYAHWPENRKNYPELKWLDERFGGKP